MGRGGRKTTHSGEHLQRFDQGIDYLNEEFPFFTTHVLNIGSPRWDGGIPTAAVALDRRDGFHFLFNPGFAENLSEAEMGFVSAHETMHILLNHLQLAKKFDNPMKFNLAADAVINDYLASQGMELPDGVVRGQELIGQDCTDLSVNDVYKQIPDDDGDDGDDGGDGGGGGGGGGGGDGGDGDGSGGDGGSGGKWREMDNHDWIHDASEEEVKAAEKAFRDAKEDLPDEIEDMRNDNPVSGSFGSGTGSNLQRWREESGVSLAWEDLLREIDPDILKDLGDSPPERPSFARRPRRLAAFEETILPVQRRPEEDPVRGRGKPTIVMALDTSGSIGNEQAQQFITLAKSIPLDKVNLFTCTFTNGYMPLDLEEPRWVGGGTNFSAVENFIQSEVIGQIPQGGKKPLEEYPQAVIVVTDGESVFNGPSPNPDQLRESWKWLMTPQHSMQWLNSYVYGDGSAGDHSYELEKFIN